MDVPKFFLAVGTKLSMNEARLTRRFYTSSCGGMDGDVDAGGEIKASSETRYDSLDD